MGQKVNPIGFRTGPIFTWSSRWFAKHDKYRRALQEDVLIRKFLKKRLKEASVSKVDVERQSNTVTVHVHTAKPGVVIGRGGQGVTELQAEIKKQLIDQKQSVQLNIMELEHANLSAMLTVQAVAADIEKRIPFRRAIKQGLYRLNKAGATGAKILVSGRLDGSEIARVEKLVEGKIPLHTISARIDYARGIARTTYGVIGIKVWVYRGVENDVEPTVTEGGANKSAGRPNRRFRRPTGEKLDS
jgi:small subunit ribosomal protein S3